MRRSRCDRRRVDFTISFTADTRFTSDDVRACRDALQRQADVIFGNLIRESHVRVRKKQPTKKLVAA